LPPLRARASRLLQSAKYNVSFCVNCMAAMHGKRCRCRGHRIWGFARGGSWQEKVPRAPPSGTSGVDGWLQVPKNEQAVLGVFVPLPKNTSKT
jgi:hypothetical protein